ncbi:MAG: phenylalanine--tRNA ligase subunit beta [Puniceicoccales bacterium]|nr:phenylalanine--tRNA ligase subunit beta [Puniceicoccales bacterium]
MKVGLCWLRRWLPGLTGETEKIVDALSHLGLEVEQCCTVGLPRENLVVGAVLSARPHPSADRLRLCQVDVGRGEVLPIVCGATNFSPGDRVPVALPGCILPNGTVIAISILRGEESRGMMCSGKELGLSDDHAGLLLLEKKWTPGTPLFAVFPENSTAIIDVNLTANRGDCLSHLGIARELAAYFRLPLRGEWDFPNRPVGESANFSLLQDLRLEPCCCERFIGWEIRGVAVGPSPEWLRRDLELAGMRSVNNLVDITNWVMLDRGQPLHAFDVRKIAGGELCIRLAQEGEGLAALNHRTYHLDGGMTVIADKEKPLVVAGIMGSVAAEVDSQTRDVVLECAAFDAAAIQLTARRLGLNSEASQRFARGVDRGAMESTLARAVAMVEEICGGEPCERPREVGRLAREEPLKILLTKDFVAKKFGAMVENCEVEEALRRLHFSVEREDGDSWLVTVPSFRRGDVTTPIDLVEEFVRFHGMDRLGRLDVVSRASGRADDRGYCFQNEAADLLIALGYSECHTYSTRSEGEICRCLDGTELRQLALQNPLTEDQTHLRPSLIPGLLAALDENLRNGNAPQGLFEIGRTWHGDGATFLEAISVAWICPTTECLRTDWLPRNGPDFHAMKAVARRVADLAVVPLDDGEQRFVPIAASGTWQVGHGAVFGNLAQQGYRLQLGLVDLEWTAELAIPGAVFGGELRLLPEFLRREKKKVSFAPFFNFPLTVRDLSVMADRTMAAEDVRQAVKRCILHALREPLFLADIWIFDCYAGEQVDALRRGIGLRFAIGRDGGTPREQEVREVFDRVLAQLATVPGVALRS